MATYTYKAKKDSAETVTGQINAKSEDEAIDLINQLGLLPVSVEEKSTKTKDKIKSSRKKVKIKELIVFTRQLANLIKSGVSLPRALSIIYDQTENKYFKLIIDHISIDIKNGRSFSDCLAENPNIFSPLYVTMVHAGEESGKLQQMLLSISTYLKKQDEVISKVKTAMTYPIFMGVVGFGTIYFILTFVLPKITNLFDTMGDTLPVPTVILIGISNFVSQYWWVVIIGLLSIVIGVQKWLQTAKGKWMISNLILRTPMIGKVILHTELARFSRTLVLLINSGVSIIRALQISIPILSNEVIKGQLMQCRDSLTSGGSFGESLKDFKDIPPMMGHMISVGEESGNLDGVLTEIADNYEQETEEHIKSLTTLFEPIMILLIGLIVGFMVFAMLMPIFQVDVLAA